MEPKAPLAHCSECPLVDRPFVEGRGPDKAEYVVVGEAPGANEVKSGIPFIGKAGNLLDKVLRFHGIDREKVYVTNACLCRPPLKDGKPTPPNAKAVAACRDRLLAEIEVRQPRRVLALGAVAAKAVTGSKEGINRLRIGQARPVAGLSAPVVTTFHPAFALRDPSKFPSIIGDVKKLKIEIGYEPTKKEVIYDTETAIQRLYEQCHAPLVALDVETKPDREINGKMVFDRHNPYLRCIGISHEEGSAIVYAREVISDRNFLTSLNNVIPATRWVMQNGIYDIQQLWGAGVTNARVDEDTLLAHYATDERKGTHDLEQLSTEYLGAPMYKTEAKSSDGSQGKMQVWHLSDDILYEYNAIDTDNTLRLLPILRKDMIADGTEEVYRTLLIPGSNALARMEYRGVHADDEKLDALDERLSKELEVLETQLQAYVANPRSPKQVKAAFELRNEELESTNAATLTDLITRSPSSEEAHFATLMLQYRERHKSRQTYVRGIRKRMIDERVHGRFLLHGTETGRLSSRDPNMQNITQGELRSIFTASNPEGVLLNADYAAIELRVAALELGSPWLLQAFREDRSIHKEVALQLFGDNFSERQYRDGKTVTFGIFYDRQAPAIAAQLRIKVGAAQRMIDRWKARVPELEIHFARTREEINRDSYLRSKFGRLRRFWLITDDNRLDVYREGYNFKIQSPAGDIMTRSLIRIDKELPELNPIITVHDSLTLDVDDASQVEDIKQEVTKIMEDTPDFDIPTPIEWKEGYAWT